MTLFAGSGAAGFVGAYDAISGLVHVYELARRTLSAYTGPLLRLRRGSDNAEQDFGYVAATGELDKAAIAAWLGAASGYVVTVYDQAGGDDIGQATAVRQPLYSATAQNGHAGIVFDGLAVYQQSDYLAGAFTNGGQLSQPYSIYGAVQLDAAKLNNGSYITPWMGGNDATNSAAVGQYGTPNPDVWGISAGSILEGAASDANFNLWSILFNGASSSFYINNVPIISGQAGAKNIDGLTLGNEHELGDVASWKGPIVSVIIADPAHDDTQRLAMQEAINTYWEIYAPFELPPAGADFAVVHIPDTQEYTGYVADPPIETMQAMTQWIADNRVSEKIQLIIHTGDVVIPSDETTWGFANLALDTIDALPLPVLYSTGNHDYDGAASANLDAARLATVWNTYLGQAHYTAKDWWAGGFYEEAHSENAYLLVTLGGQDYIILALEFGPRQAVLDWANTILTTYAARDAIILAHAYLHQDATRQTTGDIYNPHTIIEGSTDTHDGEEMWTELVKLHSNIVQVWCGHMRGVMYQVSTGDEGNIVTELLNGHDGIDGHFVIARYYLATNKVHYQRIVPTTGRVDWAVMLDYKAA